MDWDRVLFGWPTLRGWAYGLLVAVPVLVAAFLITDSGALRLLGAAVAGLLLRIVAWKVDPPVRQGGRTT